MPGAKRVIVVPLVVALLAALGPTGAGGSGGGEGGGGGGGSAGDGGITVWVVGGSNGGGHHGGGSGVTCRWIQITTAIVRTDGTVIPVSTVIDGQLYHLFVRLCSDGSTQMYWIPALSASQLAQAGRDLVTRKLPPLTLELSPPVATGGFVNFATWLAAVDPGPISATAAIPGLSATVTARVRASIWDMGDGVTVHCSGLGVARPDGASGSPPCGHSYAMSSAHTTAGAYGATLTVVWSVSWRASNGQGGTLADVTTSQPFSYRVREIQSIGTAN